MIKTLLTYIVDGGSHIRCSDEVVQALLTQKTIIDLDALYHQGAVFHCHCNKLYPKMHLRKRDNSYQLVNDKKLGLHAIGCRFWNEAKSGGLGDVSLTHPDIAKLIVSAKQFTEFSTGRSKPVYERWDDVKKDLHSKYPFMYGFLFFDTYEKPAPKSWVNVSITKDAARLAKLQPLVKSLKQEEGPWLTIDVCLNGHLKGFLVPVFSFTNPMALKHEHERKHVKALRKSEPGVIESGYWPKFIDGREVKASAFIHAGSKVNAYLSPSERAGQIADKMNAWALKGVEVYVIGEK